MNQRTLQFLAVAAAAAALLGPIEWATSGLAMAQRTPRFGSGGDRFSGAPYQGSRPGSRPGIVVPVAPAPAPAPAPEEPVLQEPGNICGYLYLKKPNNKCGKDYEYAGYTNVDGAGREFTYYGGKLEKCPNDASRCVQASDASAERYCKEQCPLGEYEVTEYFQHIRDCKKKGTISKGQGQSGWTKQMIRCKYRE